ncbi:MAG: hypothetical protein DF168_01544 [Candidatus Moanabacter tarae]|uniref:Uncharacterized protein n=1 Tax=Candidatus Moanibacter tarae TaxID=2200854 RepID=A0A2Z4AGT5_9BACT|nr:MAG: hypothetical protein DF168_01544 [Candidatus Moanabacter tarae]
MDLVQKTVKVELLYTIRFSNGIKFEAGFERGFVSQFLLNHSAAPDSTELSTTQKV